MNLVLLFKDDFVNTQQVRLNDRRFTHIKQIHKAKIGDTLAIGLLNDRTGTGLITLIDNTSVTMNITLNTAPPSPLPLTLVLALPRPNMLKRSLQTCATMGVKKIILLHSARVEKSFWQTPQLSDDNIHMNLVLGLEQAKDTVMPEVILEKNFKYFLQERAPALCENNLALVAHPKADSTCPRHLNEETILFVGPEGGFIDKEIEELKEIGCKSIHLGERILRVETAIPVLLAKLF
ncbi:MAG: 16S rRNA (uracil(1498)-N(3))-methyltransferase [Cellvibrionaceae bacterium]